MVYYCASLPIPMFSDAMLLLEICHSRVFTPWKLADATNQDFSPPSGWLVNQHTTGSLIHKCWSLRAGQEVSG